MYRTLVILTSLVAAPPLASASSIDPSGHWAGSLQVPGREVPIEVDFEQTSSGTIGAITIPSQHLSGLPLVKITIDGDTITFGARSDQLMRGVFSEDRRSIAGEHSLPGLSAPFTLTRTGESRMAPTPKSAAIPPNLEGKWTGTLEVDGGLHLELTLANDRDGGSHGQVVNLDEGGLTLPVVIAATGSRITFTFPVMPGAYTGTLNANGTELAGAYMEHGQTIPLTFSRAR